MVIPLQFSPVTVFFASPFAIIRIPSDRPPLLKHCVRPNLIIRNKMASSKVKTNVAEDFAEWFAGANVPLLVPMHYETWLTEDPEFAQKMIEDMNRIMEEKGKLGRVAPMVRGKWYMLDLGITEV